MDKRAEAYCVSLNYPENFNVDNVQNRCSDCSGNNNDNHLFPSYDLWEEWNSRCARRLGCSPTQAGLSLPTDTLPRATGIHSGESGPDSAPK